MSSGPVSLRFGIEMEFLLKPKPLMHDTLMKYNFNENVTTDSTNDMAKQANRHALREALADRLRLRGVGSSTLPSNYDKWTPADEGLDEVTGFWRCEVVSRILSTNIAWQQEISTVFSVLLANFEIKLTRGCSMHVHVSPGSDEKFSVDQMKRIIKQVIYYDGPLTKIMPRDRKENPWATSNVKTIPAWKAGYEQVPQKKWAPLFDSFDKKIMMGNLLLDWCQERYVSWNFSNVLAGCRTIEFRRPPGVDTATKAKHWVALALGYVAHALAEQRWNMVKMTNTYPSTGDLRAAVTKGVQRLGANSQGGLGSMADINESATPFGPQELARINKKKKDKLKKRGVFAEKSINSRPNTPTGNEA